jgi:hypothetical protein
MKKLIYLVVLFTGISLQAQIAVTKHDGTPITDNQILTYNSTDYNLSALEFYVRNNGSSSTRVLIECVSLTNTDGTGFELCFGNQCLSAVSAANSYPDTPVTLAPNATNGNFDHFYNSNPGNGQIMDFVFRFYQVDLGGNEVSNSITFTYRYNPNLAVNSFSALSSMGVQLASTTMTNNLELTAAKNMQLELIDLAGKTVSTYAIQTGNNQLSVAQLSAGVYIARFTTNEGASGTIKLIKN